MNLAERVWWVLTFGCVAWYLSVTVVVAVRGAYDIRHMLKRMDQKHNVRKDEPS